MNFRYYKTDRLIIFIIVAAVLFGSISSKIEEALSCWPVVAQASRWIDIFSTLTLVTVSVGLINKHGWKSKAFGWLVDLPNLNGRYQGLLASSYLGDNGSPLEMECVLEVKQTASSIHIFAYFGQIGTLDKSSRSYSVSEQIIKEQNGLFLIYYIFSNESEALKTQLSNHAGTAVLKYFPDKKILDGSYYNQRRNIGNIQVTFSQKKLLGRLVP